ncbi:MAG TPA: OmpA family protein [Polyangia bacterium]|nr:OmpA family protein [Polyangia bacterium]
MSQGTVESPGLVALVAGQLSPDLIHRAASQLGENDERTRSALSVGIPSVLATLSDVAISPAGANRLSNVINDLELEPPTGTAASRLGSAAGREEGVLLFDAEAGGRAGPLADALARTSGIRPDSAHKLLGGLTGAAVVTMRRSYGRLAPEALQSMLGQQRGEFVRRLPAPVASLFDRGPAAAVERTATERVATGPAIRELPMVRRRPSGLLPIVLFAGLLLIGLWLLRGARHRITPVVTRPVPTQTVLPAPPPVPRTTPAPETSPVWARGSTDALAGFLAGPGAVPARFSMTPLHFAFGSTEPTPASAKTLDQLASALTAYPGAMIRVESYTDNVGSEQTNQQVSEARSDAVKEQLVRRGVSASRIEAQGLGQAKPVASNDTAEGRAQNRRTEIVVTRR